MCLSDTPSRHDMMAVRDGERADDGDTVNGYFFVRALPAEALQSWLYWKLAVRGNKPASLAVAGVNYHPLRGADNDDVPASPFGFIKCHIGLMEKPFLTPLHINERRNSG